MAGRRANPARRWAPECKRGVPEVIIDYCFVRREGEESALTILLLKDRGSGALRTCDIQRMGASTEEDAERTLQGICDLGHRGSIAVNTNSEPPLIALREELLSQLQGRDSRRVPCEGVREQWGH